MAHDFEIVWPSERASALKGRNKCSVKYPLFSFVRRNYNLDD
jgi:hypothetical protein